MNNWLAANGDPSDAYVYKLLGTGGAGIDEIYVHVLIDVCADNLDTSGDYFDVVDLYGDGGRTFPFTGDFPSAGNPEGPFIDGDWESEVAGSIGPAAATGNLEIDIHIKISTSTLVYKFNGTVFDLSSPGIYSGYMSQLDVLTVGNVFGGANNYITVVTAGTSGFGSTQLINDDFSSGGFTQWDGTRGDVSITPLVANPCTITSASIIFDGQQAFQAV